MKKNDIRLLVGILILSVIAIAVFSLTRTGGAKVRITIDGKDYKVLNLNEDTSFTVEEKDGNYNIIKIENNSVTMLGANCPDKLCVKHRKIHYSGESIVCLPHRVVVEIVGGKENEVDITTK